MGTGARGALSVDGPQYQPWLRRAMVPLLPLLLRWQGIGTWQVEDAGELAQWIAAQQAGRCRVLLAFRHPSTRDPFAMAELLWRQVPRAARDRQLRLPSPVHAQFLYDRGIPLWAGPLAGWILSRMGGIPINRGGLDRQALRQARQLALDGPFSLAVAPEGANNHLGEQLGPMEPGLAQLAFWCCEDLRAAQRSETVVVVPIGLRYGLQSPAWPPIDRVLLQLEQRLDLSPAPNLERYGRLIRLAEALLALLEEFYGQLHAYVPTAGLALPQRMAQLRNAVLTLAEQRLGLPGGGGEQERCRRLESAAWQRIFRNDLGSLSSLQRRLADWGAREAELALEHMRLAEQFTAISGTYVAASPSPDRFADVLAILWRALDWLEKRPLRQPPGLGPLRLTVRVGEAIDVNSRQADYARDRRQAVEALNQELALRLEQAIQPVA